MTSVQPLREETHKVFCFVKMSPQNSNMVIVNSPETVEALLAEEFQRILSRVNGRVNVKSSDEPISFPGSSPTHRLEQEEND